MLTNDSRILIYVHIKLVAAYFDSSVDVGSEPDRFGGGGSGFGPPGFAGNAVWVGRDASLTSFHVAEDLDGILCASLVWINPVFTYNKHIKSY